MSSKSVHLFSYLEVDGLQKYIRSIGKRLKWVRSIFGSTGNFSADEIRQTRTESVSKTDCDCNVRFEDAATV